MLINEQAVDTMQAYLRSKRYILPSGIANAALAAAAPFLQGVKVKALEWKEDGRALPYHSISAWSGTGNFHYVIQTVFISMNKVIYKLRGIGDFQSEELAKAAAQADYEARILSAIEVSALEPSPAPAKRDYVDCACTKIQQDEHCLVGYPSLLCEICDGKGVVPSPRAQALEVLPCDVRLPGVTLKRGVKLSVLLNVLKRRESWPDAERVLSSQEHVRAQALEEYENLSLFIASMRDGHAHRTDDYGKGYVDAMNDTLNACDSLSSALSSQPVADHADAGKMVADGWLPIETAPKDGKHCILCIKDGAFYYSVQGAFQDGKWNCVYRDNVQPLCWMPNVRIPAHFLPASPEVSG